MDALLFFVRPLHIVSATAWFGLALTFHGFVEPLAALQGASGDRFFLRFLSGPFRIAISTAAAVTIGAGLVLYWQASSGLTPAWIVTPAGLFYTAGALAALGALAIALTVTGPNTLRLGHIERDLIALDFRASEAAALELETARRFLRIGGRFGTALLLVALVAMVLARSLG